jgi:hypothetical protein
MSVWGFKMVASELAGGYASWMNKRHMDILERVRALVTRLTPEPVCDDCVADKLGMDDAGQASRKTHELAGSHGFERRLDRCSICGAHKNVTRHR